jgi:hypothetical protein
VILVKASCLGPLGCNGGLQALIGISSEAGAPKAGNVSRFQEVLAQPTGGRKEYTDVEGRVTWVVEWFGHKSGSARVLKMPA